jgi:hypothetical protein
MLQFLQKCFKFSKNASNFTKNASNFPKMLPLYYSKHFLEAFSPNLKHFKASRSIKIPKNLHIKTN